MPTEVLYKNVKINSFVHIRLFTVHYKRIYFKMQFSTLFGFMTEENGQRRFVTIVLGYLVRVFISILFLPNVSGFQTFYLPFFADFKTVAYYIYFIRVSDSIEVL